MGEYKFEEQKEIAREMARYIVRNKATVRKTAKVFFTSKSSVHKKITDATLLDDPWLTKRVRALLERNKSERHIRGGMATKARYQKKAK